MWRGYAGRGKKLSGVWRSAAGAVPEVRRSSSERREVLSGLWNANDGTVHKVQPGASGRGKILFELRYSSGLIHSQ
jgi:hypothetical protein